ncbi:Ku protein [Quadrisphaera sp. DSM 44207]|uniref:non-homologous end joining protein Ku n=1 Tax=Quadrisphaera sp. DSM 44207 TaxID=1881057 RepID=UPI000886E214|nr:Ku protein [Quadrisphaera sp. DSM 44207]SDQ65723.1 DNA end-binding protein Ku [Quadrisphaera sp. DSM 44207]
MRAIWKGAVSFGLVSVPVRVYAATGEKDVRFHQVHAVDGGRVRYQRVCSADGEEVPYAEIAKGYETPDGELVVLTDEDLARLPLTSGREIEVVEFVPADQVDPILFAKCYYLEPDRAAAKPYALLREALTSTERVAVVKVALRQRETLAVLRVRGRVICLQTVLWPDEVREPDFDVLDADVALRPQELAVAASLVESLTADFDPSTFTDGYTQALTELIEAKVSRGQVQRPAPAAEGAGGDGQVVDLLEALQRSVERARAGRAAAEPADAPAQEPVQEPVQAPARRTASRRPVAAARSAPPDAPVVTAPRPRTAKAPAARSAAPESAAKAPAAKVPAAKAPVPKSSKSAAPESAAKAPAVEAPARRSTRRSA